jgi:hypothetical protein
MKNIFKISFLILFSFTLEAKVNNNDNCFLDKNINYEIDFLSKTKISTNNIIKDFRKNTICYAPASFMQNGYLKTKYKIDSDVFNYENFIFYGTQPFLLTQRIPENSFILNHPTFLSLLYQSNYLKEEDIHEYYLSLEQNSYNNVKDSTKIFYHSPYNLSKLSLNHSADKNAENVIYQFESKDSKLKEIIENYLIDTVQKNNLLMKLENTENMEVLRVYLKGNFNSYSMTEPFIKIFLDYIDKDNIGFSKNIKLEKIDEIYTLKNEKNPLTVFGNNVLINYTFDNNTKKGLIAFSFLKNKEVIEAIENNFNY